MDPQLSNGNRQSERRSERAHGPSDSASCEGHSVSKQDTREAESHVSYGEPNAERECVG
jgi:hypothetical protein